jgi:hypothetical protein
MPKEWVIPNRETFELLQSATQPGGTLSTL